jgi:hypothetical protein
MPTLYLSAVGSNNLLRRSNILFGKSHFLSFCNSTPQKLLPTKLQTLKTASLPLSGFGKEW